MTDTDIERGAVYTITGNPITMAVKLPTANHLRVTSPPNSKPGDSFEVMMDFMLVIIPNDLSPEQIRSLADVERLGGKIITTSATNVTYIVTPRPEG